MAMASRKRVVSEKIITNSSVTQVNMIRLQYEWTIRNFPLWLQDNSQVLKSAIFPNNGGASKTCGVWQLELNPQSHGIHRDFVGLHVVYCGLDTSGKLEAHVEFSVMNVNETKPEKRCTVSFTHLFDAQRPSAGCPTFARKDNLLTEASGLLNKLDDGMNIRCEVCVQEIATQSSPSSTEASCTLEPYWWTRILDGLSRLAKNAKFVDTEIRVHNGKILAHKTLLAANSPIFETMLLQAEQTSPVRISLDIRYDVAKALIGSMYTGTVDGLHDMRKDMGLELLAAANKYQVDALKHFCQQWLFDRVTVENAIDLLLAAQAHGAPVLRQRLINYIALQYVRILDLPKFREVPPDLAAEIYVKIKM